MLRIAICDDDVNFTGKVEELIHKEAKKETIEVEVTVFFDGVALEKSIHQGNRYDLIYLDIEMGEKNGIETARHIREVNRTVLLIYISGYEQYLKELFEVEPFRFLSKPLDEECFFRYFHDAYRRVMEDATHFQFAYNKEIKRVLFRDIIYFESCSRVVHIFLASGEEERFYGKLNDIECELKENRQRFLRIHQSYLVNYDYIKKANFSNLVIGIGGRKEISLRISEERQKKIRVQLCQIAAREKGSAENV